jgi:hypothetical protein
MLARGGVEVMCKKPLGSVICENIADAKQQITSRTTLSASDFSRVPMFVLLDQIVKHEVGEENNTRQKTVKVSLLCPVSVRRRNAKTPIPQHR